MEPKDDFEFKPINEGLGFHKKVIELKEEMEQARAQSIPQAQSEESFRSLKDPTIKFYEELDRDTFDSIRSRTQTSVESKIDETTIESIKEETQLEKPIEKPRLEMTQRKEIFAAPALGPFFLDFLVTLGLISLFAVPLLTITEVDPVTVMLNSRGDLATQISIGLLVLSVLNFYLIVSRSFFSSTVGEWAFDLAIGRSSQRNSALYPFRILWRCMVMTLTGIFILPILGLIVRRDLLGILTRTRMVRVS